MPGTRISSLVVRLEADTASFIKSLDKSRSLSTAFGVSVGTVMANVAMSVANMAKNAAMSLPKLVSASIDLGDQLYKTSQRTGIAVETLGALKHAGDLADVSFEALTVGAGKLARNMSEAQGGAGAARKAFGELGIGVTDSEGNLRSIEDVIGDVADRFAGMEDGAKKTALSLELFGRGGMAMIPLLNEGKAGLAAAGEEAEKMGLIMSAKTAKYAEEFNNNMVGLRRAVTGVGNAMAAELLPSLVGITDQFVETAKQGSFLKDTIGVLTLPFKGLVIMASMTATWLQATGVQFKALGAAAVDIARGDFAAIPEAFSSANKELAQITATGEEYLAKIAGIKPPTVPPTAKTEALPEESPFAKRLRAENEELKRRMSLMQGSAQLGQTLIDQLVEYGEKMAVVKDIVTERWKAEMDAERIQVEMLGAIQAANQKSSDAFVDNAKDVIESINKEWHEEATRFRPVLEDLATTGKSIGLAISSGIEDAIQHWKGFGNLAISILNDIAATILRNQVIAPLTGFLTDILGSALGGITGGTKAPAPSPLVGDFAAFQHGGIVTKPTLALLGKGGESKAVIPFSKMMAANGSGPVTNINLTIHGDPDPKILTKVRKMLQETYAASVRTSILTQREIALRRP